MVRVLMVLLLVVAAPLSAQTGVQSGAQTGAQTVAPSETPSDPAEDLPAADPEPEEGAEDVEVTAQDPARPQRESIVAGMSQTFVSIDATFVGSEILIFGAVSREAPQPPGRLGVVIVVEGPNEPVTVRRKDRRFGIWVNTDALRVQSAPTFYAVASSAPLDQVLSDEDNARRLVSIDKAVWVWDLEGREGEAAFSEALIRIRSDAGLYSKQPGGVRVTANTLFDTAIDLPANLTEGLYKTRIFLTRDGKIVSDHTSFVSVEKVGLERWLYSLAHDQPLLYALLALAIAIAAGYIASTAFRLLFRT